MEHTMMVWAQSVKQLCSRSMEPMMAAFDLTMIEVGIILFLAESPACDTCRGIADSLLLARHVAQILKEHGYCIENIDATLLCQRPKLAPHIPAMRRNLAEAFGLPVDAVSVKATTEEHLGFTGEGLGIAAHAVALIETL